MTTLPQRRRTIFLTPRRANINLQCTPMGGFLFFKRRFGFIVCLADVCILGLYEYYIYTNDQFFSLPMQNIRSWCADIKECVSAWVYSECGCSFECIADIWHTSIWILALPNRFHEPHRHHHHRQQQQRACITPSFINNAQLASHRNQPKDPNHISIVYFPRRVYESM